MHGESPAVTEWLATPLGRRCLANEQRLSRQALERMFGEQFLQIGAWGARNSFLRYARTQRRALLDWRPGVANHSVTAGDSPCMRRIVPERAITIQCKGSRDLAHRPCTMNDHLFGYGRTRNITSGRL